MAQPYFAQLEELNKRKQKLLDLIEHASEAQEFEYMAELLTDLHELDELIEQTREEAAK